MERRGQAGHDDRERRRVVDEVLRDVNIFYEGGSY